MKHQIQLHDFNYFNNFVIKIVFILKVFAKKA
jgi:hypothetical protein